MPLGPIPVQRTRGGEPHETLGGLGDEMNGIKAEAKFSPAEFDPESRGRDLARLGRSSVPSPQAVDGIRSRPSPGAQDSRSRCGESR
jgi:hypothetical protein